MSLIQVSDLTFAYEGGYDNIFEKVSFQIDTDWKLGFVGRNGRGKTTFLNLLLGKYEYQGKISAAVRFDYFPFPVADETKESWEIAMEIAPDGEMWQIQKELNLMEAAEDVLWRPFCTLSYGERTKVMLAVLFSRENHFLLIDEPTNHLDMEARKTVAAYLNQKKGFILVSHDRAFLDECADHILAINKTDIQVQKGNFSSWYENKKRQDQFEASENERLLKDIRRLKEASRQAGAWADKVEADKIGIHSPKQEKNIGRRPYLGEKSRKMQMRRKNLENRQERAIEEKSSLLKNLETAEDLKLMPEIYHKECLIRLQEAELFYGEKKVCGPLTFQVKRGQKIHLSGKNGCGKSSVLKAVMEAYQGEKMDTDGGETLEFKGEISAGSGLKISYVPQSADFLKGTLKEFAKEKEIDETVFLSLLRKLDFGRGEFEKRMENFSQGQKKKVLLAASLCTKAHLYIWDEPLNYIDIFSRIQLENLIIQYQPAMILVEHDRTFINKIGAETVEIR